jgi:hypothetical protein
MAQTDACPWVKALCKEWHVADQPRYISISVGARHIKSHFARKFARVVCAVSSSLSSVAGFEWNRNLGKGKRWKRAVVVVVVSVGFEWKELDGAVTMTSKDGTSVFSW